MKRRNWQMLLNLPSLLLICLLYTSILKGIDSSSLPKDLLVAYYETYSSFWGHYSISVANNIYGQQQAAYQDSLIALINHTSLSYKMSRASYYIWRAVSYTHLDVYKRQISKICFLLTQNSVRGCIKQILFHSTTIPVYAIRLSSYSC